MTALTTTTLEINKQLARQFIAEVLNRGDFAAAASFRTDDATDNVTGSLAAFLTFAAFADLEVTLEQMVAERDIVTVLATYTGTHTRTFMGIPPSNNGVTGRVAFAFRMTEGKIAETWTEIEPWGLLQQLDTPAPS